MVKETKEVKYISGLSYKEEGEGEEKEYFVEGFISTPDIDSVNDFIPEHVQESIVLQVNDFPAVSAKGSLHHDRTGDILIKAVEARMVGGKAWIRAKLNVMHDKFKKTWYEIKSGFIDGFSIEYDKDFRFRMESIGGKSVRIFEDIKLLGYGLASRAINSNAQITNHYVKEYIGQVHTHDIKNTTKEDKMTDKPDTEGKEDPKKQVLEIKERTAAQTASTPKVETKEISNEEFDKYTKYKEFQAKEAKDTAMKEQFDTFFKEQMTKLVASKAPYMQGGAMAVMKEGDATLVAYKEAIKADAKVSIADQFRMGTAVAEKAGLFQREVVSKRAFSGKERDFTIGGVANQEIVLKEQPEVKALTTGTNDPATNAIVNYYQSAVELNDIYDPIITNVLNDKTTTYGRLAKKDFSQYSAIQKRIRRSRNLSTQWYQEGDATTIGQQGRLKLSQPFKYVQVGVQVTGQMIASARGAGGIGNIFNEEVKLASADLLQKINYSLLNSEGGAAGAQKGAVSDDEMMSFEYLTDSTSNATIYGYTRSSYTELQTGLDTAAASGPITRGKHRTMMTTLQKNGANKSNIVVFTSYEQIDMVYKLMDDSQRILNVSARAGFEGLPTLDGVPFFPDHLCNTDHMFYIDTSVTWIGMQVPPTYEDLAKNDDSKSGFIKSYLNLFCEAPYWCGQIDGLATA